MNNRRTFFVDVDETLALHNLSDWAPEERVSVTCNGREFDVVPHRKSILLLVKFWKLGYDVIVWSKTGEDWANAVVDAFDLRQYVTICLTKPDFYMDDKPVEYWMGPRVYRDPKTGEEVA